MITIFFLLNTLVFQSGDTLRFIVQDSTVDTWVLGEEKHELDTGSVTVMKKAKVAPDNRSFFVYEETHASNSIEPVQTKITFYDSNKEKKWEKRNGDQRTLSFTLSNIFDSLVVLVDTEHNGKLPRLSIMKNNERNIIIEKGEWQRMVNYTVSPNCRYMAFHNRNPYAGRMWDYIYSIDLKRRKNWTYLFPMCLSCKRGRISLTVDNSGTVEVIHRGEHRIFSHKGNLIDFFIE